MDFSYLCSSMRGIRTIIFAAFVILLASCASRFEEIRPTSFELVSINPHGLRDINAVVEIGIHNPAAGFELSDIEVLLCFKGKDAMVMGADNIAVDGRADKTYSLALRGGVAENFSPFELFQLIGSEVDMSDITISFKARATLKSGLGKDIEYKDIALDKLLENL